MGIFNSDKLLWVLNTGFVRVLELEDDGWTMVWQNENADEFILVVPQNKLGELGAAMYDFFKGRKTYPEVKVALGIRTLTDEIEDFLQGDTSNGNNGT